MNTTLHRYLDASYPGLVENTPPLDCNTGQHRGRASDKALGAKITPASQEHLESSESRPGRLAMLSDASCCGPVGIVVQTPPAEELRAQTEKIRSSQKQDVNQVDGAAPTSELACSTVEPLSEGTKALLVVQDDDGSRPQGPPHNEERSVSRRPKPSKLQPDSAPARLTVKNLRRLTTDGDSPTKRKTTLRRRVAARLYTRQVCEKEAAKARSPAVATTAMSKRTKDQIGGLRLSVWASYHAPILENYVKRGGVAAVRALLKAGCNPGTKASQSIILCACKADRNFSKTPILALSTLP